MSVRPFKPTRNVDLRVQVQALENWASQLHLDIDRESTAVAEQAVQQAADAAPSGGGTVTTIPESQVVFDPTTGHDHDGGDDGTPITLTGDASGTNTAVSVDKAKAIDLPTPTSDDDWKVLSYLHSSADYVLRHPPFKNATKTTNYTITLHDFVILADATGGNITITLPTAAAATQRGFYIKRTDASANVVTIDGDGAETIDGAANYLPASLESITVVSTGTTWFIV